MKPSTITQYRLSKEISVHPRRINQIVHGKRAITADTVLRLSRYFSTYERFWINLQSRYDLEVEKDRLGERLTQEVQVFAERKQPAYVIRWVNCHYKFRFCRMPPDYGNSVID